MPERRRPFARWRRHFRRLREEESGSSGTYSPQRLASAAVAVLGVRDSPEPGDRRRLCDLCPRDAENVRLRAAESAASLAGPVGPLEHGSGSQGVVSTPGEPSLSSGPGVASSSQPTPDAPATGRSTHRGTRHRGSGRCRRERAQAAALTLQTVEDHQSQSASGRTSQHASLRAASRSRSR